MSRRQDVITAFAARLSNITQANGYQTDAGALVLVGQAPVLSDGDPDQALALVIGPDVSGYQGENVQTSIPLTVHALVRAEDITQPYLDAEAVIADIKKAVETDHDLGGLLKPRGLTRGVTTAAVREPSSSFVAASVDYNVEFAEKWGAP